MSSIIAENCDGNFKQLSVITVNFTAVKVLCTPGETWTFQLHKLDGNTYHKSFWIKAV